MEEEPNLLVALHKWACTKQQEENYFTEVLVYLLRHLSAHEHLLGRTLLEHLTGASCEGMSESEAREVKIEAQKATDTGIPDIRIRWANHLFYVEAKVAEDPNQDLDRIQQQIRKYQEDLRAERSTSPETVIGLTLLTMRRAEFEWDPDPRVQPLYWHQVAELLERIRTKTDHSVAVWLIDQYLELLRTEGFTMERVDNSLVTGIHAFNNLCTMIERAAEDCDYCLRAWGAAADYWYYDENQEGFRVWGDWRNPQLLYFCTICTKCQIQREPGAKIDGGEVFKRKEGPYWERCLDLEQEKFFLLEKDQQLNRLEQFLKECCVTLSDIKKKRNCEEAS